MFGLFSSTYDKLKKEEAGLPKPQGKMPFAEYTAYILKPRAEFKLKVEEAFRNGKITKSQQDELINAIQQNAIFNPF